MEDEEETEQLAPEEAQPEPEPPHPDGYAGPHLDDVVGDLRILKIYGIHPQFDGNESLVGEVWQDAGGNLYGNGLGAVMLFEPEVLARYRQAAHILDVSPLTVMYKRIAKTMFYRPEFVEDEDGER